MIIKVLDRNYTPIGLLENFKLCEYKRNHSTCSEFLLKMDGTSELLKVHNTLVINGHYGIIEQLTIEVDEDGVHTEVRGRGLLSLLSRRIVTEKWAYTGVVEAAIDNIVNTHLRGLNFDPSGVLAGEVSTDEGTFTADLGVTVMDAVEGMASRDRMGYEERIVNGVPTLYTVRGKLRQGLFSTENGTLLSREYDHSFTTHKNVAYVSNGDPKAPIVVEVGEGEGDDRFEYFVTESLATDATGTAIPEETQRTRLTAKGKERLSELPIVEALSCTVNPYGQMVYGMDYDLGDYILVKAPDWGVGLKAHITSITEIWDTNGFTLTVSFGSNYLSQVQKIKKGVA